MSTRCPKMSARKKHTGCNITCPRGWMSAASARKRKANIRPRLSGFFGISIGCPRHSRCPRHVRGLFLFPCLFDFFFDAAFGLEASQLLCLQVGCVPAMAQALLFLCKWCGLQFEAAQGQSHGKVFECTTCTSADRMIRRNLGENQRSWLTSPQRNRTTFYQCLHREKKENPPG